MPEPARAKDKPNPIPITAHIKVAEDRSDVTVDPDPIRPSKFHLDTVTWDCPQGFDFEIEFPETPFHANRFTRNTANNLLPHPDVNGDPNRQYKYTVKVAGITKDPALIVDP